jgi:hypothetical protein
MVSSMASVYARFEGPQGWEYQRVGKGRPPKSAKFHIRFTDAQGERCWSQPFDTPQQAQENADGVALATQAAAQGLTVAEYQDQTNAGRTPIKVAVERFLKLHRNDRPKTVKQYNLALTHLLANLPRGVRFIKDLATSDALDTYVQTLQTEEYAAKTIETRMGVIFSMVKDNKKETGVEYAAQLVSLPEPLHTRPKAYADDEIPELFGVMTVGERVHYLFFLHTACREKEVQYATHSSTVLDLGAFWVAKSQPLSLLRFSDDVSIDSQREPRIGVTKLRLCDRGRCSCFQQQTGMRVTKRMQPATRNPERVEDRP